MPPPGHGTGRSLRGSCVPAFRRSLASPDRPLQAWVTKFGDGVAAAHVSNATKTPHKGSLRGGPLDCPSSPTGLSSMRPNRLPLPVSAGVPGSTREYQGELAGMGSPTFVQRSSLRSPGDGGWRETGQDAAGPAIRLPLLDQGVAPPRSIRSGVAANDQALRPALDPGGIDPEVQVVSVAMKTSRSNAAIRVDCGLVIDSGRP